ncbi:hypothetical protein ACNTMW_31245 [Planosporangium sp. 12N6]|uniref:hypothetical protein n=1 Tax=Planosporangium spinosum TaxID=3402278 RepID=UPI003CE8185F
MSRQELAEALNLHVLNATGRVVALDGNYVGKLERGEHRWPRADYRAAFRAVLGAATDSELGFFVLRRSTGDAFAREDGPSASGAALVPVPDEPPKDALVQFVVRPGMVVVVVPADHPVLVALVADV